MKTKALPGEEIVGRPAGREATECDREWLRAALHDGLGQLLTSISFLASSLNQKLAAQKLPEATEAAELLSLAGRAIGEAKALVGEKETGPVSSITERAAAS